MVRPPSRTNAFGRSAASRSPAPAATTIAQISPVTSRGEPGEDHLAAGRLQDARDLGLHELSDVVACALDDDHRAVVQVADALLGLLALADHLHPEGLAGQHRRL